MSRSTVCPGCGVSLPLQPGAPTHQYINSSAECWGTYGRVLAVEYENRAVFEAVHQLTVDTYAAQHPGGAHPDSSLALHLAALHWALEDARRAVDIPKLRALLVRKVGKSEWPHFTRPDVLGQMTVADVAEADNLDQHVSRVKEWATSVWEAWIQHRKEIAALAARI